MTIGSGLMIWDMFILQLNWCNGMKPKITVEICVLKE